MPLIARSFRRLIVALGLVVAMIILFAYLTGISKSDVSYKHAMERHVVAETFEAGDIVALSPDGQSVQGLLCKGNLSGENHDESEIRAHYYNAVDKAQQGFFTLARATGRLIGMDVGPDTPLPPTSDGLRFEGRISRVVGDLSGGLEAPCLCVIAKAVAEQRQMACVVDKALVESQLVETANGPRSLTRTVGVSFRPDSIIFKDLSALAGLCPNLNTGANPPSQGVCSGKSGFSFDVVARGSVGLIREASAP